MKKEFRVQVFFMAVFFFLFWTPANSQNLDAPARFYSEDCEEITEVLERNQCASTTLLGQLYKHLRYPQEAREAGIEGMVILVLSIGEAGILQEVEIRSDIGFGCGEAAKLVAEEYLYAWVPAIKDGVPAAMRVTLPVKFSL